MAELATVARPYAEAAFALAREQNALPVWSQMLRFASAIVADPRISAALDNPKLSAGDKESLLLSIAGERVSGDGRNFFEVEARLKDNAGRDLRPGLIGVAKVEAGSRSWLWICTHRVTDWIRLTLWSWVG